jgi:hypothetical protein
MEVSFSLIIFHDGYLIGKPNEVHIGINFFCYIHLGNFNFAN